MHEKHEHMTLQKYLVFSKCGLTDEEVCYGPYEATSSREVYLMALKEASPNSPTPSNYLEVKIPSHVRVELEPETIVAFSNFIKSAISNNLSTKMIVRYQSLLNLVEADEGKVGNFALYQLVKNLVETGVFDYHEAGRARLWYLFNSLIEERGHTALQMLQAGASLFVKPNTFDLIYIRHTNDRDDHPWYGHFLKNQKVWERLDLQDATNKYLVVA